LPQFQRSQFRAPLARTEQAGYDEFLGPLIDGNCRRQPGAGPALAQTTAQLPAGVAMNDGRIGGLGQPGVPFPLIWGAREPCLNNSVAEYPAKHLRAATTAILAGAGQLAPDRSAG
jgi:hypothetical protein